MAKHPKAPAPIRARLNEAKQILNDLGIPQKFVTERSVVSAEAEARRAVECGVQSADWRNRVDGLYEAISREELRAK